MENHDSTTQKEFHLTFKLFATDWKTFTRKIRGRKRYLRKHPPGVGLVDSKAASGENYAALPRSFSLFPQKNNNNNKLFKLLKQE